MAVADNLRVDDYEIFGHLGSACCGLGSVWVTKEKRSGRLVAAKIIELDKCTDEIELFLHEVRTLNLLCHPNIVKYLATFTSHKSLWMVMPLMGYLSAANVVTSHFPEGLPELALALIMKDVLQALAYLHTNGIIHRSIRGSHILINSDGHCRLSGFRHCFNVITNSQRQKMVHAYPAADHHSSCVDLNWLSPEILTQSLSGYNEKSDIYSVGIVLCELANGEVPFSHMAATLMLVEKVDGKSPVLYDATTCHPLMDMHGAVVPVTDSGVGCSVGENMDGMAYLQRQFTHSAHKFTTQCLSMNPSNRPSAKQLIAHSFVQQTRKLDIKLTQILHPVLPITENTSCVDLTNDSLEQLHLDENEIQWEFSSVAT